MQRGVRERLVQDGGEVVLQLIERVGGELWVGGGGTIFELVRYAAGLT